MNMSYYLELCLSQQNNPRPFSSPVLHYKKKKKNDRSFDWTIKLEKNLKKRFSSKVSLLIFGGESKNAITQKIYVPYSTLLFFNNGTNKRGHMAMHLERKKINFDFR